MILSAAAKKPLSAREQHTANRIKLTNLVKEANSILTRMGQVQDDPSKSWTTTNVSDTAKSIKLPPQSKYQTKDEMIKKLIAQGLSAEAATKAAEAVFGPGTDNREGKVFQQAKWNLTKKLTDAGFSTSQSMKIASEIYGEDKGGPGTYVDTRRTPIADGRGGYNVKTTTKIPGARQASVKSVRVADVAPWMVVSAGVDPNATVTLDNGLRSASAIPSHWYGESIAEIMARKAEEREEQRIVKHRAAIKSASSKIPAWAYCTLSAEELERLG